MFKSFFKKYAQQDIEVLPEERRNKIKEDVLSRIAKENNMSERKKRFILKPLVIAAIAAAVVAAAAVTAGALISPPDTHINGEPTEPYYNSYQDSDGAMIEILAIEFPEELLEEEVSGLTPVGELKLDRSGGDPVLIDEKGNTFGNSVNNRLVQTKITYPNGSTTLSTLNVANQIQASFSFDYWGENDLYIFVPRRTVINGIETVPCCNIYYDSDVGATFEFVSLDMPSEIVGEAIPEGDLESMIGMPVFEARLKLFDENGQRTDPVITDYLGVEYPKGVNDIIIEATVTFDDGTVEKYRFDPANKLADYDYSAIEFDYSVVHYDNILTLPPLSVFENESFFTAETAENDE